eukprot:Opistho-2@71240
MTAAKWSSTPGVAPRNGGSFPPAASPHVELEGGDPPCVPSCAPCPVGDRLRCRVDTSPRSTFMRCSNRVRFPSTAGPLSSVCVTGSCIIPIPNTTGCFPARSGDGCRSLLGENSCMETTFGCAILNVGCGILPQAQNASHSSTDGACSPTTGRLKLCKRQTTTVNVIALSP